MVSVCGGIGHICYEGDDELKIDDYHGPSVDNEQFDISALVSYYLDGDEDIGMENFSNGDYDFTFNNEVANTAAQLVPVACRGSDLGCQTITESWKTLNIST